jgi:hypothetical protein
MEFRVQSPSGRQPRLKDTKPKSIGFNGHKPWKYQVGGAHASPLLLFKRFCLGCNTNCQSDNCQIFDYILALQRWYEWLGPC